MAGGLFGTIGAQMMMQQMQQQQMDIAREQEMALQDRQLGSAENMQREQLQADQLGRSSDLIAQNAMQDRDLKAKILMSYNKERGTLGKMGKERRPWHPRNRATRPPQSPARPRAPAVSRGRVPS